jgi:organic radical activating enzyme
MTGLGLVRLCRKNQLDVIGFIDSDPSFSGKVIAGLPCQLPTELSAIKAQNPTLKVIVAASTKEQEINQILFDLGFAAEQVLNYSHYSKLFYTLDVMGTCNLKCLSCAHGAEQEEKFDRGLMSFDSYRQVIDKILAENEVVTHISLYSWGEPMLHPALPEMIEYLHERGIAAALSSNLSIKNEALLRKVMKRDPEYLKVSLSGYYPEAYNDTHQGGDIYLVRSNLIRLRHYIDYYQLNTVIDVNYHVYNNNNQLNLQKMQELCDELGFSLSKTFALVMPLERVIEKLEGKPSPSTLALEEKLLVNVEEGIQASNPDGQAGISGQCPFLENQTIINWDLSVPVCCTTFNRGNIITDNFLESAIDQIESKKRQAPICTKCIEHGLPAYNLGLNRSKWEAIAAQKHSVDLPRS